MQAGSVLLVLTFCAAADVYALSGEPLLRTVDLNIGESQDVTLSDGATANVKLLDVTEVRDNVRSAIREARVRIEVNGRITTIVSANYRLPTAVGGVQVDCPVTKGHYRNCDPFEDSWGLDKDARLRVWPAGSPWFAPGEFVYPIKQRWFASSTQMANEPSFVDGGDAPTGRPIYYHSGLDFGGCEGMAEVVAATDGLVISAAGETLSEYPNLPFYRQAAYDCVYVLDSRGWLYRYAHLRDIDAAIRPGERVKMGQKLALIGKEGSSGGWVHLHFDIKSRQPSGKWGIQEGYAFVWEAYLRQYRPKIIAVARPHHLVWAGEKVFLDGSRSWSATGKIDRYDWTFSDGTAVTGPQAERTYPESGEYSEILKVTDTQGNVDYDFAVVLVIDKALDGKFSPTIHASCWPTQDIRSGDRVTFRVRSFQTAAVGETWDFGDGSPPLVVRSDGNAEPHARDGYAETIHRYGEPGRYLVRVEQTQESGVKATARLYVRVGEKGGEP